MNKKLEDQGTIINVICPMYEEYCEENDSSSCPKNCNDNGNCIYSRCICKDGLSGEECEKEFYKYIEKQQFNLTIKHDDIKWISDSSHSERYTRIHILLRNRINATAVAVKLYERDFLCSEKLEKVLAAKTRLQKASELVDGFYRASRRPGFLACLLDILNDVQPSLFRQALEKLK